MPWSTGRCPACGLPMGERKDPPGLYRCRRCKTAIRLEGRAPGQGSRFSVLPQEHGEMNLETIPRV
jgi:hypothetical protein